jgi:hypothetical protein
VGLCLTWAHLGVAGLAVDVAGAVALAWSFSTKKPETIRTEAPTRIGTAIASVMPPRELRDSMIRQRAEARSACSCWSSGS